MDKIGTNEFISILKTCITYQNTYQKNIPDEHIDYKSYLIGEYNCDDKKCYLADVMELAFKSVILKRLGVSEITEAIIKAINNKQIIFIAKGAQGFLFKSENTPFMYMKNKSVTTGPVAIINTTELNNKLFFCAKEKQENRAKIFKMFTNAGAISICSFTTLFMLKKCITKII